MKLQGKYPILSNTPYAQSGQRCQRSIDRTVGKIIGVRTEPIEDKSGADLSNGEKVKQSGL